MANYLSVDFSAIIRKRRQRCSHLFCVCMNEFKRTTGYHSSSLMNQMTKLIYSSITLDSVHPQSNKLSQSHKTAQYTVSKYLYLMVHAFLFTMVDSRKYNSSIAASCRFYENGLKRAQQSRSRLRSIDLTIHFKLWRFSTDYPGFTQFCNERRINPLLVNKKTTDLERPRYDCKSMRL